jgi:hypothetical protein
MKDYMASLERLRRDAAQAALARDLATDPNKRMLYDKLHLRYLQLAAEVEKAIRTQKSA